MLHWLWVLIVGAIIGAIAGALTKNGGSMGWISNIFDCLTWVPPWGSFWASVRI